MLAGGPALRAARRAVAECWSAGSAGAAGRVALRAEGSRAPDGPGPVPELAVGPAVPVLGEAWMIRGLPPGKKPWITREDLPARWGKIGALGGNMAIQFHESG